ncbi:hypothetical protein VTK73DRAFT_8595 [Phialemonium thermophilum]|uniref:Autophagy-related protein 27 n=1 Tax=Phialemonium thermophilum TaxID=223376 RepID=A0ABR3XPL5_9PEZI
MKWTGSSPRSEASTATAALAIVLFLSAPLPASAMLRCKELVVDKYKFDFGELGGPHTITTSEFHPPTYTNTTYTLDLCAPLKRKSGVKKEEDCPNGTRVCAIRHNIDPRKKDAKDADEITHVIPIAGELLERGGKAFEWTAERLSTSKSDGGGDADKQGVRLTLRGGVYERREQRAVIELLCDPERTGLEGEWESETKYEPGGDDEEEKRKQWREDELGHPEEQLKKKDTALLWDSYGPSADGDVDILKLTWYTKHACETGAPVPGRDDSWGFFTWMVILVFLATASYLIFGSWLNYYRYGARGWDLLPHADTLRDVPYLLKDWIRRLLNTLQGSGSRGGYSAV